MKRFLLQCAEYIFNIHKNNLHKVCIIFPNRRAGAFFNSYLQKQLITPVIGPKTTTVNEFITEYSDLQQTDKLLLISELYDIYKQHVKTDESFDEFYFWGEVLLSDFNDIDLYMSDAQDIFTNISDLKDIEHQFKYLTDKQKEAIRHFWGTIPTADQKLNHEKFISLWQKLYPIYKSFKNKLNKQGLAYSGMIYRQVARQFIEQIPNLEYEKYYVVGLNVLNNCEKTIFKSIRSKTIFLWDYDAYYLKDPVNEAGRFLRENLKEFPPPFDFKFSTNNFTQSKNISIVAIPSTYAQTQIIPRFFKTHQKDYKQVFDNSAVVLADESLLFPALSALPTNINAINVTMGYPIKNSVVYGFLLLLINLLRNYRKNKEGQNVAYHRYVTDILKHQLIAHIAPEAGQSFIDFLKKHNRITVTLNEINFSPLHQLLFSIPEKVKDYNQYLLKVLSHLYSLIIESEPENKLLPELIYTLYQSVEKIGKIISQIQSKQNLEISRQLYFRLFSQYAGQTTVAYEGEPVLGMQVMGILETRCLDFDNLVILGMNEGKWPKNSSSPSFIPYNLRKGFGLPGSEEQNAMYAYYFFRLLQRAKNITITYSTKKEGINTGELSRYGFQLQYETGLNITKTTLDYRFLSHPSLVLSVSASLPGITRLLEQNNPKRPLSPTAINMWLQCRLRFYFKYILKIDEPDELKDEIDSPIFGSIFHEVIERLYRPLVGKRIDKKDLDNIKNNKVLINNEITAAIGKHYLKQQEGKIKLEGKTILIFENIKVFIQRLLDIDLKLTPFELIMLEEHLVTPLDIVVNGKLEKIYIGGVIDRVDNVNGKIRIIDYKTGNVESIQFNEVEELFENNPVKQKKEILQALIYCLIFKENNKIESDIVPGLYSLRKLFDSNFNPELKHDKAELLFKNVERDFYNELKTAVTDIFSDINHYPQTEHIKYCSYCAYNKICQRF